jgi:hypothetical protein
MCSWMYTYIYICKYIIYTVFTLRAGQRAAADAYVKACQDFDDALEKMTAQVSHDPPVTLSKDEVDSYVASKVVTFFQVRVHGMGENNTASILSPVICRSCLRAHQCFNHCLEWWKVQAKMHVVNISRSKINIVLPNDECIVPFNLSLWKVFLKTMSILDIEWQRAQKAHPINSSVHTQVTFLPHVPQKLSRELKFEHVCTGGQGHSGQVCCNH